MSKKMLKATVAAAAMMTATAGYADSIPESNVIFNILNGDSGESMLINTGLASADLFDSTVTSFTSDAAMTAAVNGFISGASSVDFYAMGAFGTGFDKIILTDVDPLNDVNGSLTAFQAYIGDVGTASNPFAVDANGDGPLWEANIPAGNPIHFSNPNLLGNGIVNSFDAGSPQTMVATLFGFGNESVTELLDFNLDAATGELTYGGATTNPVPVPAAAWLFGSGLMGLVGVARRRKQS